MLVVLVFLAVSSGGRKIILMQQDVEFFGNYGFDVPLLIIFGVAQLVGGFLLIAQMTRLAGVIIVATTFAISAAMLIMDGNIPATIFTIIALCMLGFVASRNRINKASSHAVAP